MKPFKHIKEVSDIINDLKYELQHSKNKVRDAKRINSLIDCVNAFESILEDKYKTDQIDNLLAYIFSDLMLRLVADGGYEAEIPLKYWINNIDLHLKNDANQNIQWLAKDVELYNFSKNVMDGNIERAKNDYTREEIEKKIKNLFLQFKTYMLWIK